MSGFPRLIPAFTAQIQILPPNQVGEIASSGALFHVPFKTDSGFLRSEPDYPIKLDAVFTQGADYIKADPDGKHVRLEVQSIAKDKSGGWVRFNYTGIIATETPNGKVLRGDADAKTTDFGNAFTQIVFETGSPELKDLQTKVYVGSGHFIVKDGEPVTVEYKISEVTV
ncbi:hypothetical protein GQ53DRAFT_751364 [Thozetella sp. PMI_491]|nr:hypothetical protein GQ53DRAFT_751364 [Thozetella sp. PMI_491]